MKRKLKVNDFFCGCGGMGIAFKNAGYEIAGAWDFDKYAVESYRANVGDHVQKNDLTENKKKRPNKLTNARIKKEIEFLEKMFVGVDDENKKTLINSLIEEAAFLKVACFQAKEELKKEGLTTETVNASQKFVKAHPSTQIYEKYSRQYTAIIHSLIEYLPPKEKEKVDRLAALWDE